MLTEKTVLTSENQPEFMNSPKLVSALQLINEGKDQEALDQIRSEIEEHPDNGYAYYQMMTLYYRYNMYGAAMNAVNRAIKLLDGDNKWLSAAYVYRGRISNALGEGEKAVSDWLESIRLYPEEACANRDLSDYYFNKGDYDISDQYCKAIKEICPGDAYPYVALARNAYARGDKEEAKRLMKYSIKMDPQDASPYAYLAGYCLEDKDYDGVIRYSLATLRLVNGFENTERLLVRDLPHEYDEEILKQINELASQESNNSYWPHLAGQLLFFHGRYLESVPYYEESFRRGGNDCSLSNMSRAYMLSNKLIDARYYATKALQINFQNDNAQGVLAHTLMALEEFDQAIKALEEYLPYNEKEPGVYGLLADAYRYSGNVEKGLECAERVLELAPRHPMSWFTRAKMLHDLGRLEEETLDLEHLLELVPTTEYYQELRCKALQMLGRFDEAWEEALKGEAGDVVSNVHRLDKANILANFGKYDDAYDELKAAIDSGLTKFHELLSSPIYSNLSSYAKNFDLIMNSQMRFFAGLAQDEMDKRTEEPNPGEASFTMENNSICVRGEINGLPLKFVFDTGCCDVSISSVEAAFMLKNGYLEERDLGGVSQYRTSSGELINGTIVNLRNVIFGGKVFHDIRASIINNQDAPLLLGQSMIARFQTFDVNYESNTISFLLRTSLYNTYHMYCLSWVKANDEHDYVGAAEICELLYEITSSPTYAFEAAILYMAAMQFNKTFVILDKALDAMNDYQEEYKELHLERLIQLKESALCYLQRYEESLELIKQQEQMFPDQWYYHYKEGWTLVRMNRLDEAMEALTIAQQMEPNNIGSQLELGIIYRMKGMEAEALQMFNSVEDIPHDVVNIHLKAEALARAGQKEKARKCVAETLQSLELNNYSVNSACKYLNVALCYAIIGDLDEAAVYLQKSVEITPVTLLCVQGLEDCEHLMKIKTYDAIVEKYLKKTE